MAVGRKRRVAERETRLRTTGTLYPRVIVKDSRGNRVVAPQDLKLPGLPMTTADGTATVCMAYQSLSSTRGEIPGQLTNEEVRFYVDPVTVDGRLLSELMEDYTGERFRDGGSVGPWTQIVFDNRVWEISSPPVFKRGTRRTSHWEMTARPVNGGDIQGVRDATVPVVDEFDRL